VDSIALVGHSMGGLVVRSACDVARDAGHAWIDDVTDLVAVGSPHRGAPLEKLANIVSWGLAAAPETRPLAGFLNRRSAGIKDLRFGSIAEADWADVDPDALLINSVADHSLVAGIDHHFVAGVVTADPKHPIGVAMGDLIVRTASATGGSVLEPTNTVVLGGTKHFNLLRQPTVVDQVITWLDAP
jgi:pimeloyl-ACP methyl ester carboxylesterase